MKPSGEYSIEARSGGPYYISIVQKDFFEFMLTARHFP
jgi:hypothetical protein